MNLVLIAGLIVVVCVVYYFYTQSKSKSSASSNANANANANVNVSQTSQPAISINKVVPTSLPTSAPTFEVTPAATFSVPTSIPFVTLTAAPLATPSAAPFVEPTVAPFVTPSSAPLVLPTSASFSADNTPVPYSTQAVVAFLTTPLPTTVVPVVTPSPTTLAPTTPAPTPESNDPIVGNWDSFISTGAQLGPVTISFYGGDNGINNYYIEGDKILNDDLRYLSVNPLTLTASLTKRPDLLKGEGNIMMYRGKAFKIGTTDNYVNLSRPPTVIPANSTDPIEGTWPNYIMSGNKGPVTIINTGGKDGMNTYYIIGDALKELGDGYKMLTVNPKTLTATLGRSDIMKNVGVSTSGGKAFKILSDSLQLSRDPPISSTNSTDPIVGVWPTYKILGNQYGPITIVSSGGKDGVNTYEITGGGETLSDDFKILEVDTKQSPPKATMPRRKDYMENAPVVILGGGKRAVTISSTYVTLSRPSR